MRAAGRQLEPGDHAQRRRLAAAGRAEQTEELAVLDREARILDRDEIAEGLVQSASTRISAIALLRELRDDDEHQRAEQRGRERPGVERQRETAASA
jgi:hypothetical protein